MQTITYENTATHIPGWVNNIHVEQSRGYAYEEGGRFFHVYGRSNGIWVLSTGLTASEIPSTPETLSNWATRVFGATNITPMQHNAGEVITGVWRPGLYSTTEVHQALSTTEYSQRSAEQALRILIEKLDDVLLYIEPSATCLQSYGHKTRELLILACTEVENFWTQYMRIANANPSGRTFTTSDYVKLLQPLNLTDFKIRFKLMQGPYAIKPFHSWHSANPTQSLLWYNAYNKTKHDRELHFSEATLEKCLWAISAVIAMFCARHSPYPLIHGNSSLSGLFIQHFDIELDNPTPSSFYMPKFDTPPNTRRDLFCSKLTQHIIPWDLKPLII